MNIALVQWLSHVQLYNPMDCSMLGFPVLHQLPELAQTHVHWVSDAIQPSHPLSPPSAFAFNLSQHQGLFQWVSLCIRWPNIRALALPSFLPMNIQGWFPLGLTGLMLQCKGLSRVFSSTTVGKHYYTTITTIRLQNFSSSQTNSLPIKH